MVYIKGKCVSFFQISLLFMCGNYESRAKINFERRKLIISSSKKRLIDPEIIYHFIRSLIWIFSLFKITYHVLSAADNEHISISQPKIR